jgi:RimJ/RimL family protein N-acetyltransferase
MSTGLDVERAVQAPTVDHGGAEDRAQNLAADTPRLLEALLPEGVFFSEDSVAVRHQRARPEWMVERLEEALWGTSGLRYRLRDVEVMLQAVPDVSWVVLEHQGEPVASLGLLVRPRTWNRQAVDAVYMTLLVVRPDQQRRGFGRALLGETRRFVLEHVPRCLVFALVEADNVASLKACAGAGFERTSRADLVNVARTAPRASARVQRLSANALPEVLAQLKMSYGAHQLYDGAASVLPQHCWALTDGGRVLAALQAEPRRTELVDLGYRGWLKRALPWLPVLRTLVDPEDYRFLWVQHVWFADGHAAEAFELLEGVLHASDHRLAVVLWDPDSPMHRSWRRGGRIGVLAPFTQRFHVILARAGVPEAREPYVYALSGM